MASQLSFRAFQQLIQNLPHGNTPDERSALEEARTRLRGVSKDDWEMMIAPHGGVESGSEEEEEEEEERYKGEGEKNHQAEKMRLALVGARQKETLLAYRALDATSADLSEREYDHHRLQSFHALVGGLQSHPKFPFLDTLRRSLPKINLEQYTTLTESTLTITSEGIKTRAQGLRKVLQEVKANLNLLDGGEELLEDARNKRKSKSEKKEIKGQIKAVELAIRINLARIDNICTNGLGPSWTNLKNRLADRYQTPRSQAQIEPRKRSHSSQSSHSHASSPQFSLAARSNEIPRPFAPVSRRQF
ncbi:uncharacterized protein JCM6883_000803 [Sporobolomyces salmoneus]|uniref:uncharacterized protein n=1 Tax=Sporobolomyces salmoneus TaxID=183962 RepID=UPI003170C18D